MTDPHTFNLPLTDQEVKVLAALLKLYIDQISNEKDYRVQEITRTLRTIRHKLRTANALRKDSAHADTHRHTTR